MSDRCEIIGIHSHHFQGPHPAPFIEELEQISHPRRGLAYSAGYIAAVRAIYGQLVDRLWGCDHDANGVLNLIEKFGEPAPDTEVRL